MPLKIESWLDENISRLENQVCIDKHIDVFLENYPKLSAQEVIDESVQLLGVALNSSSTNGKVVHLHLPLISTDKDKMLQVQIPSSIEVLLCELNIQEPPSLYVYNTTLYYLEKEFERYIRPTNFLRDSFNLHLGQEYYCESQALENPHFGLSRDLNLRFLG